VTISPGRTWHGTSEARVLEHAAAVLKTFASHVVEAVRKAE
jgi:hypothetical protein